MSNSGDKSGYTFYLFRLVLFLQKRLGYAFAALFLTYNVSAYAVPDLSVSSTLEISSESVHVDDWLLVRVMVHNGGPEEVNNVSVDLFKNASGDLNGRSGDMRYILRGLPSGSSIPVDFVFKVKGSLNLQVMVDAPNDFHETNRSNNLTGVLPVSVNATALGDDTFEPNNDMAHAPLLISGDNKTLISNGNDDYFQVKARPGDTLIFKIYNYEYQMSNLTMFLYDEAGHLLKSSEGIGDVKTMDYRVPSASGPGNQEKSYFVNIKPGLNPTGYVLDVFSGRAPDLEITSSAPVVKKVIDKMTISMSGTRYRNSSTVVDPVFGLGEVKYHYKIQFNVHIKNTGEPLKPGEFFYIDIFRNKSVKPSAGEFGNLGAVLVQGSNFDASGNAHISALLPVKDSLPVDADGNITVGHFTYFVLADTDQHIVEVNRDNNFNGPLIVRADALTGVFDDAGVMNYTLADNVTFIDFNHTFPDSDFAPYYATPPATGNLSYLEFRQWATHMNQDWTGLLGKLQSRLAAQTTLPDDAMEKAGNVQNDYFPWSSAVSDASAYLGSIRKEAGRYDHLVAWDDDFYSVSLNPGQTLESVLQFRDIDGDLDLELYDAGTHELLVKSAGQYDRELVRFRNVSSSAKEYLLRVISVGVNPDYTLIVNKFSTVPDRDLEVTYFDVTQDPNDSSQLNVKLTYANRGSVALNGSFLDLYRSQTPITESTVLANLVQERRTILDVAGGAQVSETFSFPAGSNLIYYYAVLDKDDQVLEKNENNNTAQAASNASWQATDDNLERSGAVFNNLYTGATRLPFGNYENLKSFDEDWYVVTLGAGKKLAVSVLFDNKLGDLDLFAKRLVSTPGGSSLEDLVSSAGNVDDEYLEYENTTAQSEDIYLEVRPAATSNVYTLNLFEKAPVGTKDLVVTSLATTPRSGLEGELYRTTVAVTNSGTEAILPSQKLTVDLILTGISGGAALGQYGRYYAVFTDGLGAGQSVYATFEYRLAAGQYQVSAIVDSDNRIEESLETNNLFTGQNVVSGAQSVADATIQVLDVAPVVDSAGVVQKIDASVSVSNLGQMQISSLGYRAYLMEAADVGRTGRVLMTWDISDQTVINLNETANLTFSFAVDEYVASGDYYLGIEVNPDGVLVERTRQNNYAEFTASKITITSQNVSYYLETFRALKYGDSGADTVMELYIKDASGRLVLIRRNDDGLGRYSFIKAGLKAGKYFVRIYAWGSAMGNYNFFGATSERTGLVESSLRDPSLYERNDAWNKASSYDMANPLIQKHSIDTLVDEDWIEFTVQ